MTPEQLESFYDFTLLLSLVGFGIVVALGRVEADTSHGLLEIIGVLAVLAGNRSSRWRKQ